MAEHPVIITRKEDGTFTQGASANPLGRPRGTGWKTRYNKMFVEDVLEHRITEDDKPEDPRDIGKTVAQKAMERVRGALINVGDTTGAWAWSLKKMVSEDVLEKLDEIYERERKEDKDFLSYRLQKGTFDVAQRILSSREKLHVHMAGRRGGKTDTAARWLVEPLITVDGARCLYMGLTLTKAMEQIWDIVVSLVEDSGFTIVEQSRTDGNMRISNGSFFQVAGNNTVDERNKQRGFKWHRVVIDECQSQKALVQLHDEIFGPTLLDYSGSIMFLGTGPRVRGTYWEELWTDIRSDGTAIGRKALRLNWNAGGNPFIPDNEHVLEKVRQEHGWTESNTVFIREYLGKIAYDDDALVYRLKDDNYYTDADLAAWIASQPVTDVRFTAGLDYGFEDADGFAIICHSNSRPERFLISEYKARRTGTQELADAIQKGIAYVNSSPLFKAVTEKFFYIYADTGGAAKKIGFDLSTQFKLPIQDAFKADKDMAVEILQDEVRRGLFKVRRGGAFDDEALKTIFARNDRDELTRVVDDETYHPDIADAVLYALRPVWLFQRR